jgi:hypothetical protein
MNASEQPDQEWLQGTAPEIPDLEPFFLEQDEGGRRTVHSQVGELYGARSQLVHGRGVADQEQLMRLRGDAVKLAARCLQMLLCWTGPRWRDVLTV